MNLKHQNEGSDDPATAKEPFSVGVPLAKLIKRKLNPSPELVMLSHPRSVAAEKFLRLRTMLANRPAEENVQVLVVTSPAPGEGKSMIAANLALAFAVDKSEKVLLVDADLRRPTIRNWLTPEPKLGLSELLSSGAALEHAVLGLENSALRILPSGQSVDKPLGLLSSDDAKSLMTTLRRRYERIIIDTPPIVPFTDADVLGSMGDGILMVARAGATPVASYLQAISAVTSTKILGTVLNGATNNLADRSNRYHEYYNKYYDEEREG